MRPLTKLILLFLVAELITFLISASIPINSPTLVEQYNQLESNITSQPYFSIALSIFTNNMKVASMDFIPGIGIFMLSYSMVNTGMVLSAISTAHNVSGLLVALALLTIPHSAVELPSYAIATASGTYLLFRRREWLRSVLAFLIVPLELFLAALVEASLFFIKNPYIMWLASAPILVGLFYFYEYLQKVADRHILYPQQVNTIMTNTVIPNNLLDVHYFNLYKENWAKGLYYESRNDFSNAINYMWLAIVYLIDAIAVKLNLPYYTKEDLDRVIQFISFNNPQLMFLYQQTSNARNIMNYAEFKTYALNLVSMLQQIYYTSSSRSIGK